MAIPSYYPLIHNQWVKTPRSFKVKNPYTGNAIARVHKADNDFLEMALESAQQGSRAMQKLSGWERYEILRKIVQGIEAREQELVQTIVQEAGKPVRFATNEVNRAKLTFTWSAEEARRLTGELLPLDVAPQTKGYVGITRRVPLGVVLGISPFNFPLNLVAHKIGPAIASGNAIILKPASQTPITALILADIIKESGIPDGGVNVVPASGKDIEGLVKDGRIQKLTFTGSATVGWYLKSLAGKKHVTLELGGNAGAIVEPDADLDFAVPRLALGSFAYAGQICISVQRIYVQEEIFDEFLDRFLSEVEQNIKMGDPADPDTVVGPMIDEGAARRAEAWLKEAKKEGAKILTGGKRTKSFLEPTVVTGTQPDMKIVCEEVFAPIVVIEAYQEFTEAVDLVNHSYYGLQAGVFTTDVHKIKYAYDHLRVGGVIVNDYPTFRIDPMPYGGSKDSGFGREGIRYAIEEMTEIRLLVLRF